MEEYNLTGGVFNVSFLAVSDFFQAILVERAIQKFFSWMEGIAWVISCFSSFDCDQLGEKEIRNDGRVVTEWVIQ